MTNTLKMDQLDKKILSELQKGLPLDATPFAVLAKNLKLKVPDVIARLKALKNSGIIRQISPIFDTRKLGYDSTLVAAKVEPGKINEIAEIINKHPGVSHNYERNHEFNLWFTLAVPPDSDLKSHLAALKKLTHVKSMRMLPALKVFKIGVQLDFGDNGGITTPDKSGNYKKAASGSVVAQFTGGEALSSFRIERRLTAPDKSGSMTTTPDKSGNYKATENDKKAINILQNDLEITSRPFETAAKKLGITEENVIAALTRFQSAGIMRRLAAVLHHRAAGFSHNPMITWMVQPDRVDAAGKIMAGFKEVTHCYQRPNYPDWPYSLFTMIHGASKETCNLTATRISKATGLKDYSLLYSTREFKKVRLRYFDGSIEAWEREYI